MCPPGATRFDVSDGLPWTDTNNLVADSVDDCIKCSIGQYSLITATTAACEPCEVGKYQNEIGQVSCKTCFICPAGELIRF